MPTSPWANVPEIRSESALLRWVQPGTTLEFVGLDFKREATSKRKVVPDVAVDVAAMANTYGGCILIGVAESLNSQNVKVAQSFVGVADAEKLRMSFSNQLQSWLSPPADYDITPFAVAGIADPVIAINVRASRPLVAVWNPANDLMLFPFRTDFGNDYFNPQTLAARLMDTTRNTFLRLRDLDVLSKVFRIASPVFQTRLEDASAAVARAQQERRGGGVTASQIHQREYEVLDASPPDARISQFDEHQVRLDFGAYHVDVPLLYVDALWEMKREHRLAIALRCDVVFPRTGHPALRPHVSRGRDDLRGHP